MDPKRYPNLARLTDEDFTEMREQELQAQQLHRRHEARERIRAVLQEEGYSNLTDLLDLLATG